MTSSEVPPAAGARALVNRQNGAKSRGPVSAGGKARSARNALKHGLRSRRLALLDGEDPAEFRRFAAALHAELAPAGTLQADLVARIATAAWRARRSDRIEAALFARYADAAADPHDGPGPDLGAALIRDGHGPRAIDTLLRYRGSVLAELFRALAALKALQAEGRMPESVATILPPAGRTTKRTQEDADSSET